jgi:hypothetical protein
LYNNKLCFGEVIFSTVEGRAKPRNLQRDTTINVLIIDGENGYRFSSISGTARLESDNADALIDELSTPTPVSPGSRPRHGHA